MLEQGQVKLNSAPIGRKGGSPTAVHVSPHIQLRKYFEVPEGCREWGLVLDEAPGRTQSAADL